MLANSCSSARWLARGQPCCCKAVATTAATAAKTHRKTRLPVCCDASVKTLKTIAVPNPQGPGYPAFQAELQLSAAEANVYQVSLSKPLGFTLTEQSGLIVVDGLVPGGHAAAAGVQTGDILLATTARAQSSIPGSTQVVLFKAAGESFKTVSAALRSNTCAQCNINLVLQRPVQQ